MFSFLVLQGEGEQSDLWVVLFVCLRKLRRHADLDTLTRQIGTTTLYSIDPLTHTPVDP
jgi:hypothetical protein